MESVCEKGCILNPATCNCENGQYLASSMDDSAIECDKINEGEWKTVTKTFNDKNAICKTKNFYILLVFLLIAMTFLIAFSMYCCLIRYKAKQKNLLPFYVTNNKLKEVLH